MSGDFEGVGKRLAPIANTRNNRAKAREKDESQPAYLFDLEDVQQHTTKIAILLCRGDYNAAKAALAVAIQTLQHQDDPCSELLTDLSLWYLMEQAKKKKLAIEYDHLSRVISVLDGYHIRTIYDLFKWDCNEFFKRNGLGSEAYRLMGRVASNVGLLWPVERDQDTPLALYMPKEEALQYQIRGIITKGDLKNE